MLLRRQVPLMGWFHGHPPLMLCDPLDAHSLPTTTGNISSQERSPRKRRHRRLVPGLRGSRQACRVDLQTGLRVMYSKIFYRSHQSFSSFDFAGPLAMTNCVWGKSAFGRRKPKTFTLLKDMVLLLTLSGPSSDRWVHKQQFVKILSKV